MSGFNGLLALQQQQDAQKATDTQNALASGFDPAWYLQNNPGVGTTPQDALTHYITFGQKEGRAANPEDEKSGKWTLLDKIAAVQKQDQQNTAAAPTQTLNPNDPASWANLMQRGNSFATAFNQLPRVMNLGMGSQS